MTDLEGELSRLNDFESGPEIAALRQLAPGRTVLEVGMWRGFSAILFALAGARIVHSVDWHRGGHELGERDTLCEAWQNLASFGVRDQVVLHVGRAEVVLPQLGLRAFDLAFVDGEHDQAHRDTEMVLPLVSPGGLIVWHDCRDWRVPEAVAFAEQTLAVSATYPAGSLAVVRKP